MTGLGLSSLDQSGRERGACLDAVEGVVSDGYFGRGEYLSVENYKRMIEFYKEVLKQEKANV